MNYEKAYPDLVKTLARLYVRDEDRKSYPAAGSAGADSSLPRTKPSAGDGKAATSSSVGSADAPAAAAKSGSTSAASLSETVTSESKAAAAVLSVAPGGAKVAAAAVVAVTSGSEQGKAKSKGKGKGKGSKLKTWVEDAPEPGSTSHRLIFYMSWQRRHKHRPEEDFFGMLKAAGGFRIWTRGQRIYEIVRDGC
jgi:hypothetical protein